MKKRTFTKGVLAACLIVVLFVGLCCAGCGEKELPAGLNYPVEGVPAINEFSGMHYESYEDHFPAVSRAVLSSNGSQEEIAVDDPRLIRLLNFLAYAQNNGLSWYRTGFVEEAEINECRSTCDPVLEIWFETGAKPEWGGLKNTPRILIFADAYFAFINTSAPGWLSGPGEGSEAGAYAEQYWPYKALAHAAIYGKDDNNVELIDNDRDDIPWIDLLAYAGFVKE